MKILSLATIFLASCFPMVAADYIRAEGPFPLTPFELSLNGKGVASFTPKEWGKILICDTFERSLFLFEFDDAIFDAVLSNFDNISLRGKVFLSRNLRLSPQKILKLAPKYDCCLLSCLENTLRNKEIASDFFAISSEDRIHILQYLSRHSIVLSEETCWRLWTHPGFEEDYYESVSSLPGFPCERALKEGKIEHLFGCSDTLVEKVQDWKVLCGIFSETGSTEILKKILKTRVLSQAEKEELMVLLETKRQEACFEALLEVVIENLNFNDSDGLRILGWLTERNSRQNLLKFLFLSGENGDFLRLQILRKIECCDLDLMFPAKQNFSPEMQKEMLKFASGRYMLALTTEDVKLAETLLNSEVAIGYALLQNDNLLSRNPCLRVSIESHIDDESLLQIVDRFMNRGLRHSDFKSVNQQVPETFFQRYLAVEKSKIRAHFPMFFTNLSHNQQEAFLRKRPDSLFYFSHQESLSPTLLGKIKKDLLQFINGESAL